MKKISLIKKLSIGIAPIAIATPLIFTATSCSKADSILSRYLSRDDFRDSDYSANKIKSGYFSKDDLLLGSKTFCNGNYIMFVGSNAFADDKGTSSTMKFFTGSETVTTRDVDKWFSDTMYNESVWYKDIYSARLLHKIDRDFGFVSYIDDFDFKFHDENGREYKVYKADQPMYNVGPFDKWNNSNVSLADTRKYNKDEDGNEWFDKDEEIEESDYIRNDAQAKAYRAFINRGAAMFPTTDDRKKTFDAADNNLTGLMVVYKDGRLQDIIDLPSVEKTGEIQIDDPDKETTTLFGTINKYFTPEEEEK